MPRGEVVIASLLAVFVIGGTVGGGMWGCPRYEVYRRTLSGEAQLREAEWNRQIKVKEALAAQEAATALAEAEVRRAEGVARANEIIGSSLRENEAYLRWLWISGLQTNQMQVIYVPTEAGLPILETARLSQGVEEK